MAKKKKQSQLRNFFYNTRAGFYTLFLIAVILMVSITKAASTGPFDQNVLGKDSDNSGKGSKSEAQKEERHEEKKEEIKREFRIETEDLKVKFESEDGKIERRIESEDDDLDLDEDREEELEDEIEEEFEEENETEIASDSSDVTIKKNKIKARTGFPLTIDLATNQLIITRPDGTTKAVAILPDQAVQNFMRHKKVNLINLPEPTEGSESAGIDDDTPISTTSPVIEKDETKISLVERDGQLVYEIKGKKKLRVLGLIPVNVNTTGFVSAESGEVVSQEESIFTRLLNLISL